MKSLILKRREFVHLGILSTLLGLSGCGMSQGKAIIRGSKTSVSEELLAMLSSEWKFEESDITSLTAPFTTNKSAKTDLLILEDGWISQLAHQELVDIDNSEFISRFEEHTISFLDGLSMGMKKKVMPLFSSPWIMLFRSMDAKLSREEVSWDILLSDKFKDKVILPSSPYLLISIAERMGFLNQLTQLKQNAKAFDDINALNWLLSGRAEVVVLPLNRCVRNLLRDPRLSFVLPEAGAPLNWTTLVRPNGSAQSLPLDWIEKLWSVDNLASVFANGFLPAFTLPQFNDIDQSTFERAKSIFVPFDYSWNNLWSLPQFDSVKEEEMTRLWNQA